MALKKYVTKNQQPRRQERWAEKAPKNRSNLRDRQARQNWARQKYSVPILLESSTVAKESPNHAQACSTKHGHGRRLPSPCDRTAAQDVSEGEERLSGVQEHDLKRSNNKEQRITTHFPVESVTWLTV